MLKIKNILLFTFKVINIFIKKKNIILFYSTPDISDNALAYYYHIRDKYRCIWVIKDEVFAKKIIQIEKIKNIEYIRINSLKEIYYSLISKIHINTHGSGYKKFNFSKYPLIVSLWHGSPIKKIGKDINETPCKQDILISGSDFFTPIMIRSIASKNCKVVSTGLPRNDWLTKRSSSTLSNNFKCKEKIVIWMPTFVKSRQQPSSNKIFDDGKILNGHISFLSLSDFFLLNETLSSLNLILYIKLHPFDILNEVDFSSYDYNNIKIIKSDNPDFMGSKLYCMLSESSGLISDLSSVIFDYIYTSNLIGIDTYSYKNYTRPMYFELDHSQLNSFIIYNIETLIQYLKKINNENLYKKSIYIYESSESFCTNVEKVINENL
ncbi:CDP-glycerol glycerophosphotransferase family protein [Providencia sp. PROV150]|uniref:CDP-glycerol glycerophosphotransferase family protein n=1 Tax=Providencia sp. PROV150 TaxID=2949860 RepID=UPI00234BAB77|nr:CDP-glycerol glycerophosphotransferase family protein [Providencia sp. PROV150]